MAGPFLRRQAKRATALCLILAFASPAAAQYFGRNKVRYRAFEFQILRTEHFDIYFYPAEREGIDVAARLAERWHARLERVLQHTLRGRQPLILYASHTDFQQTNVISEDLSEGTGGVTEPLRRRIVLPLAGPIADTDHVLGHEIVHAFQFDMTARPDRTAGDSALSRLPLWFIEGMAEYLSLGPIDANTAMKLRDAIRRERLPSFHELGDPEYFPYQWGHAALAYIAGRYGETKIAQLLTAAARTGNVEAAIVKVLGVSEKELTSGWHHAIRSAYAPVLEASAPVTIDNRALIQARGLGADLNIGPALSPDGKWIAFLSSRGLLSIDLYVADAATGRIARRLTSTATDPHFSSIQFIHSAGAWDPSSEHIAMATVTGGRPALAIFDVRTGRRRPDIVLSGIDEILNPAWSPDGRAIAFTAMRQGLTDLYVYDLESATLAPLTRDAYADLHPAWSPDNRRIVFASDRFSSDLDSLEVGALQLAIVDRASGAIEPVAAPGAGKHITPQWSPDGKSLYFVGDPDGVANIYRLSLETGTAERLTAMETGVSGITPTSPALSVSTGTGAIAFSVFENDKYNIYIREPARSATPFEPLPVNAAALPPLDVDGGHRAAPLFSSVQAPPAAEKYPASPYKPRLSLAGISQPTAGVGVGQFGVAASGGAALAFTDVLGDHAVGTAFQINSGLMGSFSAKDIAIQTAYMNMEHRWNWGVAGGQLPYISAGFTSALAADNGELLEIDREIFYRQTERAAAGILAYPFDRLRRVEFRGGFAQTAFDQTLTTKTTSLTTGTVLSETKATQQFAPHLNLVTTSAALVMDSANFGPTSPLQGQRYRLEISPAFGSINFAGVLTDYRRYAMPMPFYTLAARVLHYGRYGRGGDDPRLYPVYINNPAFVRGYDGGAFRTDCRHIPPSECQVTDPLAGSRMLIGNLELRFPLLRPFGVSRSMYGVVPVEVALFADTGVAWTARERPAFAGGTRPEIGSAGLAFRVALGVLVAEFDATRPFQRPEQGWVFGFNLIPGW